MRIPLRQKTKVARAQASSSQTIPAPVGGWNARDALANMKPLDAVALENWFPSTSYVEIRGGYDDYFSGMVANGKTLATYNSLTGTNKMFCGTQSGIYDVSSTSTFGHNYVELPGVAGEYVSTPDSVANSITGDIDIRIRVALDDWTPSLNQGFVNKNLPATNQRSFRFAIETGGKLFFQGTTDGTIGTLFFGQSTVAPTVTNGSALWLRVTCDVDDGAGHNVITFYTSSETEISPDEVTWTQLGDAITNTGTTSFFDGTADLEVGGNHSAGEIPADGKIWYADIRSGIGGAPVAVFDANDALPGATSVLSSETGETWTCNGSVVIAGPLVNTSVTNGKFQWLNFGDGTNNYLIMCNGVDKPQYYNGTSWIAVDGASSPALTGVTTTTLIAPFMSKGRLFFIQKDTLSFWYLAAGAAGGALTEFDLSPLARAGGYLMAGATWTLDAGDGPDDRVVFVTSEGEVIVYAGTNPSSGTTWSLVGVYSIGKPLGRRCFAKYGGDLVLITQNGAFPLSAALQSATIDYKMAISFKIENAFTEAARNYGSNFGWCATVFPARSALLVNIPQAEDGAHEQFVMNTITQAWCKFTSWDAEDFAVFNNELYFTSGKEVLKAWSGTADGEDNIIAYGKTAFSALGKPGLQKQVKMFRPVLAVNGSFQFLTDIDVDFEDNEITGVATYTVTSGALWDAALWDVGYWAAGLEISRQWTSPAEYTGNYVAGKIKITTNSLTVQWMSSEYIFEYGSPV